MQQTRIAFDLGGVIIERGAIQNFIIQESIVSVRLAVQKYGPQNIFVISKAKDKYKQRNIDLLNNNGFFKNTKLLREHVHFVDEYEDKGTLGRQLNITHILDDSVKVARIALENGFIPIIFGSEQTQFLHNNPTALQAKNWKNFRKLIQKIKR